MILKAKEDSIVDGTRAVVIIIVVERSIDRKGIASWWYVRRKRGAAKGCINSDGKSIVDGTKAMVIMIVVSVCRKRIAAVVADQKKNLAQQDNILP